MRKKCKKVVLISAYLDGQLDERDRKQIEEHLRSCSVCREELESLKKINNLLFSLKEIKISEAPEIDWIKDEETLIPPIYHKMEYRYGITFAMLFFIIGVKNYPSDLTGAFFVYFLIHVYLYLRDFLKGGRFIPV